ncbi:probable cytochrome P450 313a4 isoform X1 [Drosophila pseudoobscura]|uniref:Probable cytochrome P450 313a4 isoform X1 n=3 Tax=Drosophila pseudoobscura pseudoobscura TaxID=46245 RepID=A0A6I8V285_DROPS|nr:probable cytochrome P450 313a4 isoform X1 [Drosophila pseudoobscura]
MLTWTLWCGLLFVLWIYFLWSRRRFYLLTLKIPGPIGYPLLGMAHKLMRREDILNEFGIYMAKHGPTIFSWLGPIPFMIVSEPQVVQDILTSPHCVNKGIIYKAVDDGAGVGLFSLKDPRWSVHRKLLNPAFGHKVLLSFLPIFNKETAQLLSQLDALPGGGEKDLIPLLQSLTLGIATQTTMGCDVKSEENFMSNSLMERYQCCLETMTDMCFSPWLNSRWARQLSGKEANYYRAKTEIRAFIRKLIQKRLSEDTEDSIKSKDKNIFLNLATDLLRRGVFDWKNVEDESNIIVFGAFETTANTVYYVLMLLAMFPQYQERAFEEIKSLFPNSGDFEVSYEDTQQMVYLDLVLNESMRVIPPVPVVSRQTSQDLTLTNGIVVPKGVQIAINMFHMHRSKKIWGPEAESFNPDNFLPHNTRDKHPYAFIPFTKGIRNCIGWRYALISAKVTLAKLLRNYRFKTSFKFEDLYYVEDITMKLKAVPKLEIQKRI